MPAIGECCSATLNNRVWIIRRVAPLPLGDAEEMNAQHLLLLLAVVGCGRGELQGPPAPVAPEPLAPEPVRPACVPTADFQDSRWACDTVSALEVVRLEVLNADGTSPWTGGPPYVRAWLRNTTGQFLNYPGVEVSTSTTALQSRYRNESLYGMSGCQEVELGLGFSGAVPSGASVTFTARPAHINGGAECALSFPPMSVSVTAP